ncbi:MAG: PEGA domain-containing protein [Armatimonadota bacterium]
MAADASVIGLTIREFARRPVADQARLKAQLEALAAIAIEPLGAADRVVLESPAGLVVTVLSGAQEALQVAERAQAGGADLHLCIGVNYGPVKLGADPGGDQTLIGDGIVGAVTLANLATRGRFLISRSFHEALAAFAPHRASEFGSVGVATDDNVRTHELFTLNPAARTARQRRLIMIGALAVVAAVGAGVSVRVARSSAKRPAIIGLQITPQGDIFVDGELKGRSPPLARLEVSPGAHTIEVRSAGYPPLRLDINLKPAEEIRVTHEFATGKKTEKRTRPAGKAEKFIDDVRKRLGL